VIYLTVAIGRIPDSYDRQAKPVYDVSCETLLDGSPLKEETYTVTRGPDGRFQKGHNIDITV
jgi:hypothetical protein